MRKKSIARKTLVLVLSVCLFSILSMSVILFITERNLSGHSRDVNAKLSADAADGSQTALVDQAHLFLQIISQKQAKNCDALLDAIKYDVMLTAGVVEDIFNNPDIHRERRPIVRPSEAIPGVYNQTYSLSITIPMTDEIMRELDLLSNMNILMPLLAANPHTVEIYVGMESGLLYNYTEHTLENPDYDPRVRPWYITAVENPGAVIFSEVYEDAFGTGMVLTAAKAVYDNTERLIGVAGLDILLEDLKELITGIQITDSGYAFIIDSEGHFIVHPDMGDDGFVPYIKEEQLVASTGLADGYRRMMNGEEGNVECEIDGKKVFMTFSPISVAGWSVGMITFEDDILESLEFLVSQMESYSAEADNQIADMSNNTRIALVLFVVVIIVMMMLLSVYLTHIISKPIRQLTEEVVRIGEGNFEDRIPIKRNDEIGILTESFNKLADNLYGYALDAIALDREKMIAEEASRSKSNFLATMSHEIRTPLNAVIGISQVELQNEDLPKEYADAFGKIYNSGTGLLGLINDILDMSKIEAGKMELIPEEYDTASLINDAAQLNAVRIGSKQIEFLIDVDENLPSRLCGDELRIKQVLNNLLSNAIKYTKKGYVKLSVSHMQDGSDVLLRFAVEDTGQGLKPEDRDRLFSEYLRFNAEDNRTTEGTGIGLNITKRLVEMMDGTIGVESEYGKGSVFSVMVRQKPVESPAIGAGLAKQLASFSFNESIRQEKLRILRTPMPYGSVLVVDDIATNLYVAEGMLRPYKLRIETAASGFEAIEKIEAGGIYDIVFMDHMMPKMDGIETTRKLRESGYTGVIVALTANALVGNDSMFRENGFDGFVAKPISVRQLDDALNEFIRDRHPEEAGKYMPEIVEQAAADETSAKLIGIFCHDAADAALTMREALTNGDIKLFTITAHAMKSALASIGEADASEEALALESAGHSGDMQFISAGAEAFIARLMGITEKLRPDDASDDYDEQEDERTMYLIERLRSLELSCDDRDMESAYAALSELMEKPWKEEIASALENIHDALHLRKDFDEAAEKTIELSDSLY